MLINSHRPIVGATPASEPAGAVDRAVREQDRVDLHVPLNHILLGDTIVGMVFGPVCVAVFFLRDPNDIALGVATCVLCHRIDGRIEDEVTDIAFIVVELACGLIIIDT